MPGGEPKAAFEYGAEYRSCPKTKAERNAQVDRPKKITRRDGFKFTVVEDKYEPKKGK